MDRRRAAAALLALAACIACSEAAPTTTNHTALELHEGSLDGCYYNFQHYGEGDRIMTNEPCLNCTCHNRMLMCYLRVCPFTKAIGQDCTVEKRADQCCPIVTCPDVPVDLLTSTSTTSPAEYGATGLGKLDRFGCSIHGKYFPEGAKVPPTPNKPCEHCYCIRNMTTCVMQECTLHVDGCTPIYNKDVCCPVRYSCDHPEDELLLLDDMTTTVRPTPGFLLTTTTLSPVTQISQDCVHDDQIFPDGALIKTEKACEHCYCMKGDIVCVVQECGTPMENEGKNCTSLPPRHGQCCPDTYICEGDERVTDSTTDIVELTTLPPRRVGIEGSGYRNEPDEPYTEINKVTTEIEGSGEEFATVSPIDTGDNETQEKEITEMIDEILLTTTESGMQSGQSTEPDKGQNTIPDSVIDIETAREPITEKETLSSFGQAMSTVSEEYATTIDLTSDNNEITTIQSVLKVDEESVSDELSPTKDHEKATTDSSDVIGKTTLADEYMIHTNPTIIIESDQTLITTPATEFTNEVQEPTKQEDTSTEIIEPSIVTVANIEESKFTDGFHKSTEAEIFIESTTIPGPKLVVTDTTSLNPNINEIDDNLSPTSSPSRIPGEGDCLLNGITYSNNTSVPSSNNCHTGCKCISSIIKCDPIICSPPPEYMENMNDCQPIYDTPNSCCPTYVCSVKETIPPESHSHMSGTESPKPSTATECNGNDCIASIEPRPSMEPTECTSGNCLSETPVKQEECESNDCKDQVQTSPSQDCSDGKCHIFPDVSCEGDNCETETPKDKVPEKDLSFTTAPTLQEECESNDCKEKVQTSPSIPTQDCSDGKCQILTEVPCEGEKCSTEAQIDTITEKDLESTKTPATQEECISEDCKDQVVTSPSHECSDEKCQILPVVPCEGENCKTVTLESTSPEKDLAFTTTPALQEKCKSNDCNDQVQTSPLIPSQDCSDGKCQILPVVSCEGENCKTETLEDSITEKDLGITKTPAIKEECESSDCKDLVQPPPTQPTQDCSDGKCQTLPVVPCEGINCKSDVPENTFPEKNKEPNVYDLPSKTCNEENGCDETNLVGKDECVGESCKRKDVTGVGLEVPSKCSGSDCKLHDEPSAQSTEQPTEVTEGSTVSDINLQKTETIESHLTTIEEKLTDSELDVTRPPTNIEYSGKQSTTVVPIVTELPQQYDTEKEIVQTEIPIIQTGTEIPEEVTKTGTLPTESPRYPIEQTTESQDKHSSTDEQLTTKIDLSLTKVPEYFEIETEESFTKENEQFSTKKPYISTDAPLIVLADENTESPQITVTESNIVSEKDEINTEYPEIIDKEDVNKKYPEILVTAIEKTTEASFNIKETTLPAIVIKEKEKMQSEIDNKNELFDTKVTDIVATEKELLHTEVTETFTEHQEAQTNAPEIFTTEKELVDAEILKVTAKEKETSQTGIPDKAVTETSQPELPESTEKQIIQTITPELETTAKSSSETESVTPLVTEIIQFSDATVTQKADVQPDFTEVTTEKEVGGVSIPDQHTIKEESTTTNVFDQASVEDQTVISLNTATDEAGSSYVTKETILEPETTITKKPEINYEVSKPIYSEEKLPTEDGIEVATERLVTYIPDVTKIETVPSDSYESVTQSINEPSLLEENVEITTKDSHILVTDELEMNTKSPQEISTKLGENAVPTDTDMLYTSSPDHFETVKSNEVSQTLDESVTESQMIITQEPEILSSKHYETFTLHVETVTDKYEESPITATDSPVQLTSIITDEQEKPSEVPELDSTVSQMEDKTTILPDTYLTTAISTDKPYVIPSLDSDKYDKDVTDKIHYTQDDIEKLTTADSSKLITEKPEIYTTQQQTSSDQKLDLESSFLTTEIVKKTEDSTDSEALVTEISETHSENPVLEEEKHQDSTTKTPEQTIVTETHKEGTDDNFTTQSTYKEELPTDQQQTISQEASYTKAVTDSDIETSSKTIVKDETESQEELTTTRYQTTEITDKSESESTISFTKTPEFEIATQRQPVSDTVKEEVTELPSYTEKEGVKPFISDEQASDTTEDSGLQEIYLSEHMGSQTTSQVQLEISTEKTSLPNKEDIDKKLQNEISTNVPVAITIIEQESSDRVTTEPQILHTSSEDKLSTNIDTLNMQKEQELDTDIFLTTPSSSQPEDDANLTELPMSLVTHVDHGSSSQTTLSDQIEMTEQALITNVDQTLEEEKPQTTLHEKYVTELQKQSTTEIPSHHITTQELQTETASKLNEDESNKLNTDQAERSTTSVMQNEYSMDQKTTPIPNKQYDFSTDGSTAGTVSSMYTSSFDTEKTIADNQPEITTTVPLREKEPHLSHEQGTPETESVDEMVKLPLTTQTVSEVVTTTTPSIVLDDEHIKEPISTTDIVTTDIIDQQRTEHPETILHDLQTIAPEKETSLTEETSSVGTETPKISTEKESDIVTSVYIPIVSELTEKPLTEITEINEFDNTEKDKPTEIGIQSVDQTTTSDNLELVTESDIVYTPSKVFSDTTTATQDNESSTEASDTKAPIQFNTSTDKIFTIVSEQDEQSGIPDASDNEKTAEDIASHSSTLIPEISTLITETQTKPTGIEKVTVIEENLSEEKTPKPIVTVKEEELPSEIYTTQPTIEKVSLTTEQPTAISIESEKHDTDVHTPTEFTPTTLQSSQSAYTHKEFDLSEDHKETTEPGHEASETTPFLVELQEHTHQQIDDSSRTSTEEIFTTALYERGDQNLDLITDKHEDAYQTTLPTKLTEHEHDDKLFTHEQDKTEQVSTTSSTIIKEITERLNDTLLTTSPEINLEDQEKQHITTVQDVVVTTSAAPQTISEKETFTTTSTDTQKLTYSTPETVGISTEKDNLGTELPLQPEASIGTTLLDEDLSRVTSQATTSKMVDETTRFTPITDKPSQPEEKPIKTTPPTQELAKPIFDDEINEGIPSPDFPPSGAGGYGQEPDYVEEDQAFGPGTCRYGGKVYVSAQQIPRDDPCDFCFCFRSDIICLQQSCPPPIHGCHEEPIQGFCCPRYECPVSMATTLNVTTTTTTTTTTLPPHFLPHAYKGAAQRRGCQIKGHTYKVGEVVRASSGPCLHCTCGGDGQMKCDPKACTPEPMLRQMIAAAVSAKRRR